MSSPIALPCEATIDVPFLSSEHAAMVIRCLNVDKELQAESGKVIRALTSDGNIARAHILAADERTLRLCVSSFMDVVSITVQGLNEFAE